MPYPRSPRLLRSLSHRIVSAITLEFEGTEPLRLDVRVYVVVRLIIVIDGILYWHNYITALVTSNSANQFKKERFGPIYNLGLFRGS